MATVTQAEVVASMSWPSSMKAPNAAVNEMEVRLMSLEQQIAMLLAWKSTIAATALRMIPDTSVAVSETGNRLDKPLGPTLIEIESEKKYCDGTSDDGTMDKDKLKSTVQTIELVVSEEDQKDGEHPIPIQIVNHNHVSENNARESLQKENNAEQEVVIDDTPVTRLASDILAIIEKYGQHIHAQSDDLTQSKWSGKLKFLQRVIEHITKDQPIKMVLPAFPWKSINRADKVTGTLPDLGETLALARLNALCEDIRSIYPKGGEVTIATDGLVFDGNIDIVGIPDGDTWAYSEALMAIAAEKGFKNIKLVRVMDLLGLTNGPVRREEYLSLTSMCRTQLLKLYGRSEDEVRTMMQTDSDTI